MARPSNDLLAQRTKKFALRLIRLAITLQRTEVGRVLARQLLRSGTSVGAKYREAMRARSTAEFISKPQSSLQELEETNYWLELLVEGNIVAESKLKALRSEADELTAMMVSSVKTAKNRATDHGR